MSAIKSQDFKFVMMFVMTVVCFAGMIPLKIPSISENEAILSYLNCFSAGIFLSMALIHLLPESVELFGQWTEEHEVEEAFPLPYVMLFLGYMVILLIDRVIMHRILWVHEHDEHNRCVTQQQATARQIVELPELQEEHEKKVSQENTLENKQDTSEKTETVAKKTVSRTSGVILTVVLAAHSFFEGLALGLMVDFDDAWKLAIGLVLHKTAASVSLGSTLRQTGNTFKLSAICLTIFALMAPIGVAAGLVVTGQNQLLNTIMIALSAGTFIYVSCTEIIKNEFERKHRQWLQFIMVLLGGCLVVALWFLEGTHEHGHDDHEEDDHDEHEEDDHHE